MDLDVVRLAAIPGHDAHIDVVEDGDDLVDFEALDRTVGDVLGDLLEGDLEHVAMLQSVLPSTLTHHIEREGTPMVVLVFRAVIPVKNEHRRLLGLSRNAQILPVDVVVVNRGEDEGRRDRDTFGVLQRWADGELLDVEAALDDEAAKGPIDSEVSPVVVWIQGDASLLVLAVEANVVRQPDFAEESSRTRDVGRGHLEEDGVLKAPDLLGDFWEEAHVRLFQELRRLGGEKGEWVRVVLKVSEDEPGSDSRVVLLSASKLGGRAASR